MYPLEKNIDLSFLIGRTLRQVCVESHQVLLNFDQDLTITVEEDCLLSIGADLKAISANNPMESKELALLLDQKIEQAKPVDEANLLLEFSGARHLTLLGASDKYECYSIIDWENHIAV